MTFHTPTIEALTPHAFDARLAQLTRKGFTEHEIDEWTAFFDAETDSYGGIDEQHRVCPAIRGTLMGAWREDADGNLFCGDRAEVEAIIGAKEAARWEACAEEWAQ